MEAVKLGAVGLIAGILAGWLGIGGGALMVPMMILGFGIETKTAIATSLAVIVPISVSAACKHWGTGRIDFGLFWPMALAGLIGAVGGAWILDKTSPELAKRSLAVFLVYSAVRLWMSTTGPRS